MNIALIDTDILSYFLNGDQYVLNNIQEYLTYHNTLSFSEISYFEILAGLSYKKASAKIKQFDLFSSKCDILKLSNSSIRKSATIYGELRRKGITIGSLDLLIAGIAIDNNMVLITNNTKHYSVITGLRISNWKT